MTKPRREPGYRAPIARVPSPFDGLLSRNEELTLQIPKRDFGPAPILQNLAVSLTIGLVAFGAAFFLRAEWPCAVIPLSLGWVWILRPRKTTFGWLGVTDTGALVESSPTRRFEIAPWSCLHMELTHQSITARSLTGECTLSSTSRVKELYREIDRHRPRIRWVDAPESSTTVSETIRPFLREGERALIGGERFLITDQRLFSWTDHPHSPKSTDERFTRWSETH